MGVALTQLCKDILEKKAFAHLATIMADGSPQVTPVWCEHDGTHVIINAELGRVKDRNMRHNPHVALSCQDPENAYQCCFIRGRVVDMTEEGAEDHINKLAKKYLGLDKYPNPISTARVIYKIEPLHISGMPQ